MKDTHGALVASVEKGSPAEKGGLQVGDVITQFNGKPINTSSDLPRIVAATPPGKTAPVTVLRKGANRTLNIALGEMPTEQNEAAASADGPAKSEVNRLGLALKELTPQQKKELGKNGLLVLDAQGGAAQAGIRRGDVVLGMNNSQVQNLVQFNKQLAALPAGKTVALLVQRGANTLYVPVKIGNGK